MKKIVYLFIISLLSMTSILYTRVYANFSLASNQKQYYAKITNQETFFYTNPMQNEENALFKLPFSYFVKLSSSYNDEFFYGQYMDLFGYIKKEDVTVMQGTPSKPFASANFRVFAIDGIGIYNSPYKNNEKLEKIPYLTENLVYYGEKAGNELVPEKSNIWYYCKYNNDIYGYTYSVFCDKLSIIPENNESFSIVENPIFENKKEYSHKLSKSSMIIIICGVSIPCVIVFYLLLKPTLNKEKILNTKPKIKKKKHGDYFEFDDNELN